MSAKGRGREAQGFRSGALGERAAGRQRVWHGPSVVGGRTATPHPTPPRLAPTTLGAWPRARAPWIAPFKLWLAGLLGEARFQKWYCGIIQLASQAFMQHAAGALTLTIDQ